MITAWAHRFHWGYRSKTVAHRGEREVSRAYRRPLFPALSSKAVSPLRTQSLRFGQPPDLGRDHDEHRSRTRSVHRLRPLASSASSCRPIRPKGAINGTFGIRQGSPRAAPMERGLNGWRQASAQTAAGVGDSLLAGAREAVARPGPDRSCDRQQAAKLSCVSSRCEIGSDPPVGHARRGSPHRRYVR